MNPNIVFSRTPLGQQALSKRDTGLNKSLRLALILVDGHSDVNQLRLKAMTLKNLEQELETLALQGFIRANSQAWQDVADVSSVKTKLIDAMILVLGDDANKLIKILKEAPDDIQGLESAVIRCKKIVGLTIDESRASELKKKCLEILGSS